MKKEYEIPEEILNYNDNPQNKEKHYLAINPTGHIPMIKEGSISMLGGEHQILLYIIKSRPNIKASLYPDELQPKIRSMLGWYSAKLKTPC